MLDTCRAEVDEISRTAEAYHTYLRCVSGSSEALSGPAVIPRKMTLYIEYTGVYPARA